MNKIIEYEIYIYTSTKCIEEIFNNFKDAKKRYNYLIDKYSNKNKIKSIVLNKTTQVEGFEDDWDNIDIKTIASNEKI